LLDIYYKSTEAVGSGRARNYAIIIKDGDLGVDYFFPKCLKMNVAYQVHNPREYSSARLANHFQDMAVPRNKNHDDKYLPSALISYSAG
jgi:hypothetical protein